MIPLKKNTRTRPPSPPRLFKQFYREIILNVRFEKWMPQSKVSQKNPPISLCIIVIQVSFTNALWDGFCIVPFPKQPGKRGCTQRSLGGEGCGSPALTPHSPHGHPALTPRSPHGHPVSAPHNQAALAGAAFPNPPRWVHVQPVTSCRNCRCCRNDGDSATGENSETNFCKNKNHPVYKSPSRAQLTSHSFPNSNTVTEILQKKRCHRNGQ